MLIRFLLIFLLILVAEICLLVKVASLIGGVATAAAVIVMSLLGGYIVLRQGGRIFRQIRQELSSGRIPAARMLDGALVVTAGLLLVFPGFITDLFGILLLIPATRRYFKMWLGLWLQARISRGGFMMRRRF
jgi:UPF0716 protein FxsA